MSCLARRRRLGAALMATATLAVSGGCSGVESEDGPTDRPPGTRDSEPAPQRPLPAGWYEDPDGDALPTALEQRIGRDPRADDCLEELDCPGIDPSQEVPAFEEDQQNTLLMLDSSGSMAGRAGGGKTKIEAAKDALERFATATPDSIDQGLLVYGQTGSNRPEDKAESCRGPEVISPIGEFDYRSAPEALDRFEPRGFTPIAGALEEARRAFSGEQRADNRIILVSDGVETCGGDPVRVARSLKRAGIAVTVDVVGFDIEGQTDAKRLRRIAEVTGGDYTDAQTGADLDAYFRREFERRRQSVSAYRCLLNRGAGLRLCQIEAGAAVEQAMIRANLAEQDPRKSAELRRRRDEIKSRFDARADTRFARIESLQQRVQREYDEADERLQRRYGAASPLWHREFASACAKPLLQPIALDPLAPGAPDRFGLQ